MRRAPRSNRARARPTRNTDGRDRGDHRGVEPPGPETVRSERLRRRRDFEALMRDRDAARPARHRLLTLRSRPNGLDHSRVGYAVGRPVGGAVVRNRVRRRLRELVRATPLQPGHDIVLAARPATAHASFQELRDALTSCMVSSGILMSDGA